MLHLDPTTPAGLLDTLGHLGPALLSAAGTFGTLFLSTLTGKK
jgi:hypothetical protein